MLLISVCLAWVLGIFLGSFWHLSWLWMSTACLPFLALLFIKRHRRDLLILALALAAFFGGMAYYPLSLPRDKIVAPIANQKAVKIQGVINAQPEIKDTTTHLSLSVQSIDGSPASGQILLFVPRYPEYCYGDVIVASGRLSAPPQPDGFDYQAYLARQGTYSTMFSPGIQVISHQSGFSPLAWIYSFRQKLSNSLAAALPEPQAGLAQGTVLGIRTTISPELRSDLSVTGTAHLIAISGINLSIIAGIIVALGIRLFGRRHYYYIWIALTTVWFYTILAGWQAPVIRSAIMASVFLLAELLGRQKMAIPALTASAAIMVGLDPQVLWSVSFQLSFLAMSGLIMIAPLFQDLTRNFVSQRWGEEGWAARFILPITDSFSVSLGSVIFIWPIVAYNFGVLSLVGPLTTFLISPALTPIIILCSLTAVIGLVSAPAAQVVGWSSWLFLTYMLDMIKIFAALPLVALQTGALNLNWVRLYYTLLALGLIIKSNFRRVPLLWTALKNKIAPAEVLFSRVPKQYIILPLLVIAVITSSMVVALPDSCLHVSFLDVGEGDAILIQAAGQNVLVDGGPGPLEIARELSQKLPFWDRRIDLLILTHPHQDHLSGLVEVLKRYKVNQVMEPRLDTKNPLYSQWLALIREKGLKLTYAARGQQILLKNGALIEVLNPPQNTGSQNEEDFEKDGIVLKISLGQHSFLLTADIDSPAELSLLEDRQDLKCMVLKIAHHGSDGSTSPAFLSAAQPQFAVISCGAGNSFGHPSPHLLERLSQQTVYRTDLSGAIEFTTDGTHMWVKKDR